MQQTPIEEQAKLDLLPIIAQWFDPAQITFKQGLTPDGVAVHFGKGLAVPSLQVLQVAPGCWRPFDLAVGETVTSRIEVHAQLAMDALRRAQQVYMGLCVLLRRLP